MSEERCDYCGEEMPDLFEITDSGKRACIHCVQEEIDALRERADKAEAEVERLREAGLEQTKRIVGLTAENERLRELLQHMPSCPYCLQKAWMAVGGNGVDVISVYLEHKDNCPVGLELKGSKA